ncbi:T9SS type A sorting domain-containing protein [Elizabethkingia sp. JS20170427COW]|uniref:T9SS type A sorting domain-containing protein n=1 Tax=Elizabethkingia sp. JS20170427COW TaxID=2583851 RepID=UPI00110FFEC3|nr:T9SS type A sorting domain-containing protein [Elizabethkingia sp. JS20170427COW]QCX53382.1 T9SS type A sorting domain-containing protein [Elizabethkingia sp. JS20170427COW]
MKIKGEDKIIVSYYELPFMDNETFERTPNNHLIVDIYNPNLSLDKSVSLDISSAFPDEPYTVPMAKFGTFHFGHQYDISDTIFNNDPQLEFFYSLEYYDMLQDKTWTYHYVGDENGNRIKSYEKSVLSSQPLNSINGSDNQVAFVVGSEEENGIEMFNIESWTPGFYFPASYNGDALSDALNRIPHGNSYSYLIGLATGITEEETSYGLIHQYSPNGELEKAIKLNISKEPYMFYPLLNSEYLNPKLINNDDDIEFSYIHKHKGMKGNTLYNQYSIAKASQNPIFELSGYGKEGDISGSGFIFDANWKPIKLGIVHEVMNGSMVTKFFNLPLNNGQLSVQEVQKDQLNFYYNHSQQTIGWKDRALQYEIYDMSGRIVKSRVHTSEVSISVLSKGVYIIKIRTDKGQYSHKFIVR